MEGVPQGDMGQIKAPFAGKILRAFSSDSSSAGMGERIIKPAFGKACSAKSGFRFTEF
jgi:hypothetical protein